METLFFDKAGNRLWYINIMGYDISQSLETVYTDIHPMNFEQVEGEYVSEVFGWDKIPFSIFPTVSVYKNNEGHYAVMALFEDSMGTGCIKHSLLGGFCFKEVYAYFKHGNEFSSIELLMKDLTDKWQSFSIFFTEAHRGSFPLLIRHNRWVDMGIIEQIGTREDIYNICKGDRYDANSGVLRFDLGR